VIGPVGVSRLQAVGDAGPIRAVSGADEGRAVLGKAEEHLLDAVIHRTGDGGLRVGPETSALLPVVRSVDQYFAAVSHQPRARSRGDGDQSDNA